MNDPLTRDDPANSIRPDYDLLFLGPILLYEDTTVLDSDIADLRAFGYTVFHIDLAAVSNSLDFYAIAEPALGFPGGPGANLDHFYEHVRDDSAVANELQSVIVLRGVGPLLANEHDWFEGMLDAMADAAHHHLIFGQRLGVFISGAPENTDLPPVGGRAPHWRWMPTEPDAGA